MAVIVMPTAARVVTVAIGIGATVVIAVVTGIAASVEIVVVKAAITASA